MDVLRIADRTWPLLGKLTTVHVVLYRATGGRIGQQFPGQLSVLLLDHVGAKSGQRRTTPLLYLSDGDDLVLVASKGGYSRHPGWYHNLRAHPDTTVQVGARRRAVHARVAEPGERARLWPAAVQAYSGYASYQHRTDREIPLVILEPR